MNNINKFDKMQDTYSKYRPNYSKDGYLIMPNKTILRIGKI